MANIYLVGGLTPRTDLDNYQTAFLSKEKAEESKAYWNSFHEDNDYDEYHIDSIEIEDLAEHDKQIREDTIDDFVNAYMKDEEQYDGCRECERNDDYCCIQCFRDRFLKQLKGTENE